MSDRNSILQQKNGWRLIDQSRPHPQFQAIQSFAFDDTLCMSVGSGQSLPTARAWVHLNTVVLGIQDTKLPALKDGFHFLTEKKYDWVVRNSGGLAVALDEGVLNISLIFPDTERGIDINRGYDSMLALVRQMFSHFQVEIEAREIVGSYCPGSYDLSINGRKFAGISQRRIRKGVAVQIYLCVTGSGEKRAELIKDFYHVAKSHQSSKFQFPGIRPEVMASLSELLSVQLSVSDVMFLFMRSLQAVGGPLFPSQLNGQEMEWFEDYFERMIKRNEPFTLS